MSWICGSRTICIGDDDCIEGRVLRCKMWECDECFSFRLLQLKHLAMAGKPNKFITLTASQAAGETADEAAQALVHAWRMVVQRAKREGIIDKIEYLCVFESFKSGFPHLHILARCAYTRQAWLSERMNEYEHSPIVFIEAVVNVNHAAIYVAKYCSKGPERWDGCKRYWRSMHWIIDPTELPAGRPVADHWAQLDPEDIQTMTAWYERHGWWATWDGERKVRLAPLTGGCWPWLEAMDRGQLCTGKPRWSNRLHEDSDIAVL